MLDISTADTTILTLKNYTPYFDRKLSENLGIIFYAKIFILTCKSFWKKLYNSYF